MIHYLKTIQPYYNDVKRRLKPFEVRKNDRDFNVGDVLILQEYDHVNKKYTGWELPPLEVIYMLNNPEFCKEGYVILGIADTATSMADVYKPD